MSQARRNRQAHRDPQRLRTPGFPAPSASTPHASLPQSLTKAAFSGPALWVSLALIIATACVYAAVWNHGFVDYDDTIYVRDNPYVYQGLSWDAFKWALTTGRDANWFPLTWLSLMLDAQFHGLHVGGYLLTNLAIHIASTLLLFGLLHYLTGGLWRSAFVSALFALHPLHVESVAWVAERKDVLSAFFWMFTMCAYVRYVRQPDTRRYLVTLLCFALGLMSKAMLVTLPFVLLLLDYWPLGRVVFRFSGMAESERSSPQKPIGYLVKEKIPLFALTVVSSIVTFAVQQKGGAVRGLEGFPLDFRLQNALVAYTSYLGKMLWPAHLAAFYPYPRVIPAWASGGSLLCLLVITGLVLRAALRRPYLPVGWLWYLGTLVPVIGLVQVGNQAMADRYTYIPLVGIFIMVAWGIPDLLPPSHGKTVALSTAAGLAVAICAFMAWRQVGVWKDTISLWSHAVEVTSDNLHAHLDLGVALMGQGKIDEAISHYQEALRINPYNADVHYNLGNALLKQGKREEAISEYQQALRIAPGYVQAHSNLGMALADLGRVEEAIPHYQEALRLSPTFAEARNNLGIAFAIQKRFPEAIDQFKEALRIAPNYANARNNLGHAFQDSGRTEEAVRVFSEAVQMNPADQQARRALAELTQGGVQNVGGVR
jgi:protein O-mannosyl-transferase